MTTDGIRGALTTTGCIRCDRSVKIGCLRAPSVKSLTVAVREQIQLVSAPADRPGACIAGAWLYTGGSRPLMGTPVRRSPSSSSSVW